MAGPAAAAHRRRRCPVQDAATPDTAQLAVTAAALTARLGAGTDQLASCARWLIDRVRERLDSASADNLATATLRSYERLAAADPDNTEYRRDLTVSLEKVGDVRVTRGDPAGALEAYIRAVDIAERLVAADPDNSGFQRDLAVARWRPWWLGGMVTGGPAVTVYSPPMTGNRPELPGSYRGSRWSIWLSRNEKQAITGPVRI
jgi:hypothetical protein